MSNPRTRVAIIALILLFVVGAVLFRYRNGSDSANDVKVPTIGVVKRIELMLAAAQAGDVDAYRECFADPLRKKLDAAGDRLSSTSLRKSEDDLKSFSCDEPDVADKTATVVVEKVYADHNERFRFRLKQVTGDWKIAEIIGLDKHAPKVKFGTPVVPGLEIK